VDSEIGKGTSIRVTLPIDEQPGKLSSAEPVGDDIHGPN
jgi:hypothetical protein